jgi:LmbE family N-acetylglucosaminyl deacetylase
MQITIWSVEVIGHTALTVTFIVMLIYSIRRRKKITRYLHSLRVQYWFIISLSGLFAIVGIIRLFYLLTNGTSAGMNLLMDLLTVYPSVVAQSMIILFMIKNRIVFNTSFHPRRVLAIGAHPDDLEIAAGATLARMLDHGHAVFVLIMTHGDRGGDANIRYEEAHEGAKYLGITRVKISDFNDTELSNQVSEMVQEIEVMIGKFKPDLILTHSLHDVHQDHRAVYEATLRAGRNHCSILCYESPSVTQDFYPTFYIDVRGYIDIKIEAIRSYYDQRDKPYMKEDQIRGKLAFRGGQAKVEYAESFEVVRLLSSTIGEF